MAHLYVHNVKERRSKRGENLEEAEEREKDRVETEVSLTSH